MKLILGDSLERLRDLPTSTIDCIVTDPPYGWRFMGKAWDGEDIERMHQERMGHKQTLGKHGVPRKTPRSAPSEAAGKYDISREGNTAFMFWTKDWAEQALRVLKPGGHMLVFCGPRTYHAMAMGVEMAGFEIRDQLQWNFGSGFPKSLDVYKACLKKGLICECADPVRSVRQNNLEMGLPCEAPTSGDLQSCVQGSGEAQSARMDGSHESDQPKGGRGGKHTRVASKEGAAHGAQPSVEGRGDLQAQQGQLHRPEIREMPQSFLGDESQGRVCDGTSAGDGSTLGPDVDANGSGAPQGPQHEKQSTKQSRTIPQQSRPQACGSCGKPILQKGYGTALKPANEPIVLARKPLEKGLTVAQNVLKWGTGALNIDGTRIETSDKLSFGSREIGDGIKYGTMPKDRQTPGVQNAQGRWPANLILGCACEGETHDAECAAAMLDAQSGVLKSGARSNKPDASTETSGGWKWSREGGGNDFDASSGGASRFFYVAKSSKRERNAGLEGMPERSASGLPMRSKDGGRGGEGIDGTSTDRLTKSANHHPTVKPVALMQYLITLVCPPGGIVLDPFLGSGTTLVAAAKLKRQGIGIEQSEAYLEIARRRIAHAERTSEQAQLELDGGA